MFTRSRTMLAFAALLLAGCGRDDSNSVAAFETARAAYETDYEARSVEAERYEVACVKGRGYEYTRPADPAPELSDSPNAVASLPEENFLRDFGYGITGTRLGGPLHSSPPEGPNDAYRAQLSEGEAQAYDATIAQCRQEAARIQRGPVELLDSLEQALIEIEERILAHPLTNRAFEQWATCMALDGWQFSTPFEPPLEVISVFNRFGNGIVAAALPPTGAHDVGTLDPRLDAVVSLEELERLERAVAVADFECRDASFHENIRIARADATQTVANTYVANQGSSK